MKQEKDKNIQNDFSGGYVYYSPELNQFDIWINRKKVIEWYHLDFFNPKDKFNGKLIKFYYIGVL